MISDGPTDTDTAPNRPDRQGDTSPTDSEIAAAIFRLASLMETPGEHYSTQLAAGDSRLFLPWAETLDIPEVRPPTHITSYLAIDLRLTPQGIVSAHMTADPFDTHTAEVLITGRPVATDSKVTKLPANARLVPWVFIQRAKRLQPGTNHTMNTLQTAHILIADDQGFPVLTRPRSDSQRLSFYSPGLISFWIDRSTEDGNSMRLVRLQPFQSFKATYSQGSITIHADIGELGPISIVETRPTSSQTDVSVVNWALNQLFSSNGS